MRRRRPAPSAALPLLVLLAAALLAVPAAAGGSVELTLAGRASLSDATVVAGHVVTDPPVWGDPALSRVVRLDMGSTNLTACPITYTSGTLLQVLAGLDPSCPEGRTYTHAGMDVHGATHLRFAGALEVRRFPAASMLVLAGDHNGTLLATLSADGALLHSRNGTLRFAATSVDSAVHVHADQGDADYNGTGYAFVSGSADAEVAAAAATMQAGPEYTVTATRGDAAAFATARHPMDLLWAQGDALGADGVERRGNVSRTLDEYGHVGEYVDGALLGRLAGTVDGRWLDGVALVAAPSVVLHVNGRHATGDAEPSLVLAGGHVALDGHAPRNAPWIAAVVLALGAAVVVVVRRKRPVRRWPLRATWAGAALVAWLVFDVAVLGRHLGAGALGADAGAAGSRAATFAFGWLTVLAGYVLIALPGRILVGRLAPQRLLLGAEAAWALVWVLLPLVFPGSWVALGYGLARL